MTQLFTETTNPVNVLNPPCAGGHENTRRLKQQTCSFYPQPLFVFNCNSYPCQVRNRTRCNNQTGVDSAESLGANGRSVPMSFSTCAYNYIYTYMDTSTYMCTHVYKYTGVYIYIYMYILVKISQTLTLKNKKIKIKTEWAYCSVQMNWKPKSKLHVRTTP